MEESVSIANVKSQVMKDALNALPSDGDGLTFQEIHKIIDRWSIISIKHVLRDLRVEGIVIRSGAHNKPRWRKA